MNSDIDFNTIPISSLSYKSRKLLSSLLNPKKVLPSDDANKLPRDWQGLAALVNIPSELLSDNGLYEDKTAKVLDMWQQNNDGTATVRNLILYLQKIDRYDVFDDLIELYKQGLLIESCSVSVTPQNVISKRTQLCDDFITNDDVKFNCPQHYDAYVLFAKEDKEFVLELLSRMREQGYMICTEDDILAGFQTQFEPISTLLSKRCDKIILIYSPDFFNSAANKFYINYVQADGIESNKNNIIPCMYRHCDLPNNHRFYHKLYYTPPGERATYDFWERLSQILKATQLSRIAQSTLITTASSHSVNITEVRSQNTFTSSSLPTTNGLLALPNISLKSNSSTSLNLPSVEDNTSITSETKSNCKGKKISGKFKKFFRIGNSKKGSNVVAEVSNSNK